MELSLRNIIAREMLVNTLIHREFTSSYTAKFIIEQNKMYVENANRAAKAGVITPENLEPNPKNPIIASFFRTIGWSDQLGSGVRNLYKYTKLYSGQNPVFHEGDVFSIVVPLDESYSFDKGIGFDFNLDTKRDTIDTDTDTNKEDFLESNMGKIMDCIRDNPGITQAELKNRLHISIISVKRAMKELQARGKIERTGSSRKGYWKIVK